MDVTAPTMESGEQTTLTSALDRLWQKFLPEIGQRVALLESAAQALAAGELNPAQQQAAHAAAHKLAGVLGTFNLAEGTTLAREIELKNAPGAVLVPADAEHLSALSARLRALVENRSGAARPPK